LPSLPLLERRLGQVESGVRVRRQRRSSLLPAVARRGQR